MVSFLGLSIGLNPGATHPGFLYILLITNTYRHIQLLEPLDLISTLWIKTLTGRMPGFGDRCCHMGQFVPENVFENLQADS
jgi:hypothetical protein